MREIERHLKLILIAVICLASNPTYSQSTFSQVYSILQTNCTFSSCHDNNLPKASMSLIGTGADPQGDVYDNLVGQIPTNAYAAGQGYVRINPGDPHTSFLFRKINRGFDAHMVMNTLEGDSMPQIGSALADVDLELIRQWILFGAPKTGNVVDTLLIQDYYTNGGIESMPTQPAPPPPGQGIQLHLGPFFIPPSTEQEYFLKYNPKFADTLESNRVDMLMGDDSHHFILERFNLGEEANESDGYRQEGAHLSTVGITSTQFSGPMFLPQNTAFLLPQDSWLDLNSHYINFSSTKVLKAEVFINIYTQPFGTAKQIMHTGGSVGGLITLSVPNDGTTLTLEAEYYDGSFIPLETDVYVWSMTSHTHQWGTDFDIYKRSNTGARGTQLFDGSYMDAIPGGNFIDYDYAQPPTRHFDPFLFTKKDEGFIFEASWVNTGPNNPVTWGLTSEDEMFIMGIFYVLDTTGLSEVVISNKELSRDHISVYPNPAETMIYFDFKEPVSGTMAVYNTLGKLVDEITLQQDFVELDISDLSAGIYVYRILSDGDIKSGRFSISR